MKKDDLSKRRQETEREKDRVGWCDIERNIERNRESVCDRERKRERNIEIRTDGS